MRGRTFIIAPTERVATMICREEGILLSDSGVLYLRRADQLRGLRLTAADEILWSDYWPPGTYVTEDFEHALKIAREGSEKPTERTVKT